MCLICWNEGVHDEYPFMLISNRDEDLDRETTQADWWSDHPEILAGRDNKKGGTWMGITKGGRFAALTNFRTPVEKPEMSSRGQLVTDFLLGDMNPKDYVEQVKEKAESYNGFNLIVGDFTKSLSLWYCGSRSDTIKLTKGQVYGVGNASLDTPWHKLVLAKQLFEEVIKKNESSHDAKVHTDAFFDIFCDPKKAAKDNIPNTGVEEEEQLSSIFIDSAYEGTYGTRSQTAIVIHKTGKVTYVERSKKIDSLKMSTGGINRHEVMKGNNVWVQVQYEFDFNIST
eukprot:TRINITY_DN816_c0_g1_i1.p1 TRINITY_DN816_c0_g1~~TRINITY_DN816_c0_g1_i1.p1  ORF type:complete len:284 (+),score=71.59 TRINITY_DN816_c0_g1_i1:50-901(+)